MRRPQGLHRLLHGSVVGMLVVVLWGCSSSDSNGSPTPQPQPQPQPQPSPRAEVFVGDQVNPRNWDSLHFVRDVVSGRFVSELARRSNGSNDASYIVRFQPGAVSYQAEVTVSRAVNNSARVRAFIQGRFYRDTTPASATSRTGEIIADFGLLQDEGRTDVRIGFFILRCEDESCSRTTTLAEDTQGSVVALGTTHTLAITFDGTRTFTFTADNGTPVARTLPAANTFVAPPASNRRFWSTAVSRIDQTGDEGFIAATFDNLRVNGTLLDDFEPDGADGPGNIAEDIFQRVLRVQNGRLDMELSQFTDLEPLTLPLLIRNPQNVNDFRADVRVNSVVTNISGFVFSPDVGIAATLINTNATTPTNNSQQGDIFCRTIISFLAPGTSPDGIETTALAVTETNRICTECFRCTDATCGTVSTLFRDDQPFLSGGQPVVIRTGETHRLAMAYDRNSQTVTFGLDTLQRRFTLPAGLVQGSGSNPAQPNRYFRIQMYINTATSDIEESFVSMSLDNVEVNGASYDAFASLQAETTANITSPQPIPLVSVSGTGNVTVTTSDRQSGDGSGGN